jgi:hypothetical protein
MQDRPDLGCYLWAYTYAESSTAVQNPVIEAALAEQANGDVLVSSPTEVWGLCH